MYVCPPWHTFQLVAVVGHSVPRTRSRQLIKLSQRQISLLAETSKYVAEQERDVFFSVTYKSEEGRWRQLPGGHCASSCLAWRPPQRWFVFSKQLLELQQSCLPMF